MYLIIILKDSNGVDISQKKKEMKIKRDLEKNQMRKNKRICIEIGLEIDIRQISNFNGVFGDGFMCQLKEF